MISGEWEITVSWFQLLCAANVGCARNVSALRDGRPLEDGREDGGWERHIFGAITELGLSELRDIFWNPAVGRLDTATGDVGGFWHVKSTDRANGSLIVRPHDPPEFPYVLVTIDLPKLKFRGWAWGVEAKAPEFWKEVDKAARIHRAAYFMPQSRLRPMETLPTQEAKVIEGGKP